jgi:hypothetical protein
MHDILSIGSLLEEVEEGFNEFFKICDLVMHFRFDFFLILAFKSLELLYFRRELREQTFGLETDISVVLVANSNQAVSLRCDLLLHLRVFLHKF